MATMTQGYKRNGSTRSSAIDEYVAHHNIQPRPLIWTKSAADILEKLIRANRRFRSKLDATLH